MRTAIVVMVLGLLQAPSGGVVAPIYRDLLKPEPFNDAAYADRCGFGAGPLELLRPTTPRDQVAAIVRQLDAADVPAAAERALAHAAKALPGARVTVCLVAGELSRGLPYLDGVGGMAFGGGRIKLILHPGPGGLRRVPYTVAHEYHHEVEGNLGPGGFGSIDIVVREGKADHFATGLYPALRPRHTLPLSDAELAAAWKELMDFEAGRASGNFRQDFMIGRNTKVTPWPGYRLGYEMVELYFRGKRGGPADWIKTPAHVIVDHYRQVGRLRASSPQVAPRSRNRLSSSHSTW